MVKSRPRSDIRAANTATSTSSNGLNGEADHSHGDHLDAGARAGAGARAAVGAEFGCGAGVGVGVEVGAGAGAGGALGAHGDRITLSQALANKSRAAADATAAGAPAGRGLVQRSRIECVAGQTLTGPTITVKTEANTPWRVPGPGWLLEASWCDEPILLPNKVGLRSRSHKSQVTTNGRQGSTY